MVVGLCFLVRVAAAAPVTIKLWDFETTACSADSTTITPSGVTLSATAGSGGSLKSCTSTAWPASLLSTTYLQFKVSSTGYSKIHFKFEHKLSASGSPTTFTVQYNTDNGATSNPIAGMLCSPNTSIATSSATTWPAVDCDLSNEAGINDKPNVYFRILAYGAGTARNWLVDNVTVTGESSFNVNVSYSGNGVGTVAGSGLYVAGSTPSLTATPTGNSVFTGWSGDCSGNTNPLPLTVNKQLNCVANFSKGYVLTLQASGTGTGTKAVSPVKPLYIEGESITLTNTPNSDSFFRGWQASPCAASFSMPPNDLTCTVAFEKGYTIALQKGGTGDGTVEVVGGAKPLYAVGEIVTLKATTIGNSVFTGWSPADCGNTNPVSQFPMPSKSLICTANFEPGYVLTTKSDGTGTGTWTVSPVKPLYIQGEVITLTNTPSPDAFFRGWQPSPCADSFPMSSRDLTCTVTFEKAYTIALQKDGTGDGTVEVVGGAKPLYAVGENITLKATPIGNSVFTGWSPSSCGNTDPVSQFPMPANNLNCIATFKPGYAITINQIGTGTGTVSPPKPLYIQGEAVTLTSTPGFNSFPGVWQSPCASSFPMPPNNLTCTVAFEQGYTVALQKEGTGNGNVDIVGGIKPLYKVGENIALTATPDANSLPRGWSPAECNPLAIPTSGNLTFAMPAKDLTCKFRFETAYQLTIAKTGTGSGSVDLGVNGVTSSSYAQGEPVTLRVIPQSGSLFDNEWSPPECNNLSTMPSHNLDCTATLRAAQQIVLTTTGEGKGTVTTADGKDTYAQGSTVNLVATANVGSTFLSWSCDNSVTVTNNSLTMPNGLLRCAAEFGLKSHSIALQQVGQGNVSGAGTYKFGSKVTLVATPIPGFIFKGWSSGCAKEFNMPDNDLICTASFEVGKYQVITANGGTGNGQVSGGGEYDYDSQVNLTAVPNPGSLLVGWEPADLCKNGSFRMPNVEVLTCTAFFKATRKLTVNVAGEGSGVVSGSGIYPEGSQVSLSATPSSTSVFAGWFPPPCGDSFTMPNSDLFCMGNFVPGYQVITKITGSGSGVVTGGGLYAKGAQITLTATPNVGSVLADWIPAFCGTSFTMPAEQVTCMAIFRVAEGETPPPPPPVYTSPPEYLSLFIQVAGSGQANSQVKLDPEPVGNCPSKDNSTCYLYRANSEVSITVTPADNAFFNAWGGSESCSSKTNTAHVLMSSTSWCTAYLQLKPHQLQLTQTGTGHGRVSTDLPGANLANSDVECHNDCYNGGAVVKLLAAPAADSSFTGWQGDEDCQDGQVTMDVDKHCQANFVLLPTHTLTLTMGGNGQGSVRPDVVGTLCGANCWRYVEGSQINLTATAAPGSTFTAWSGDCPAVTMDTDKTCTAIFSVLPTYTLTVTTLGNGSVTSSPSGAACGTNCASYVSGTPVTLTATPAAGFFFKGWEGCNPPVMMDRDQQCTAVFTATSEPPPPPHQVYQLVVTKTGPGKTNYTPLPPNGYEACVNLETACEEHLSYEPGTIVTLTVTPAEGSVVTELTCPSPIVMDADKQCTVTIHQLPSLTVNLVGQGNVTSDPAGLDCGDQCRHSYEVGKVVTLTPTAASGFKLAGWSEECSNGQVTMDKDHQCTVTFEQIATVQFAKAAYQASEENDKVTIQVNRLGSLQGEISVIYTTPGGTAIPHSDYEPVTGKLTWLDGDNTEKTFTIPLILDQIIDDRKTVSIKLLDPVGEVILGTPDLATLTITDAPWFSSVQFVTPAYTVNESAGQVALLVSRAGSKLGELSVSYTTGDGTATANSDYEPLTGTLTWANGDRTHKVITIPILADNQTEGEENLLVTLANPSNGAQLGPTSQATVTLIDSSGGGSLQFAQGEYTVNENSGQVTLEVQRLGGNTGAVAVTYTTSSDSATASDYTSTTGVLEWADGDLASKTLTVPILSDAIPEGPETFTVLLTNPTGNANLGAINPAKVIISETTGAMAEDLESGLIQWHLSDYRVLENAGSVTLTAIRSDGQKGEVTVNYTFQDEQAKAYSDYLPNSKGVLHWEAGEEGPKQVSIGILDDTVREDEKSFQVTLSAPSGRARLGVINPARVTIQDNDGATVQFASNSYQVSENSAEVIVTVTRQGSDLGEVAVNYATYDGSAKASQDYLAKGGTLRWFSGESGPKSFAIPLIYDPNPEGEENFQVKLSNLLGQVTLGTPGETTITILEDGQGCQVVNQIVDCFLDNTDNPKPLSDLTITARGTVQGGLLAGTLSSQGMLQRVILLSDSVVLGGQLQDFIKGTAVSGLNQLALLREVSIKSGTALEQVIVGRGTVFEGQAILGAGVRFEDNNLIPYDADLSTALGRVSTAVLGRQAVQLGSDVLEHPAIGGILGAINSLHALSGQNLQLVQHPRWGYLWVDSGNLRYSAIPLRVRQIIQNQGGEDLTTEGVNLSSDQTLTFVTHTGREVVAQPVVQAPEALQAALQQLGFGEAEMQEDGNFRVPAADGSYVVIRPSLFATLVPSGTPLGIAMASSAVSLVFDDENGLRRQQNFYPAPAHALGEGVVLEASGKVRVKVDKRVYQGQLDYQVTSGVRSLGDKLQVMEIGDVNGDGRSDYQILYPQGVKQVMFRE